MNIQENQLSHHENKKERMKGIMNSAFDVNMGGVVVTGEKMKKCLGLKSDNPSGLTPSPPR